MSTGDDSFNSAIITASGSNLGSPLQNLLMCDSIQPGSDASYQTCKNIYIYHPLGAKMADGPITSAMSQQRVITVKDHAEEVVQEFKDKWELMEADTQIASLMGFSRVYGATSLVVGVEGFPSDKPLDMNKIWDREIFFNVLDPLNTSGSLVCSQIPNRPSFNHPMQVTSAGEAYHRSRAVIMMNERPVYLAFTNSSFGYTGRSVYQRALYPLKSYVRSMIANDLIQTKLALLIAKQKSPGPVVNRVMQAVAAIKRNLLKVAQTGNVLSIDTEEGIETLNMQNVDGAGTYSRTNILKDVATAADMPAKLLENETMVSGFGEGTEDARNNARYIEGIRQKMKPAYMFMDNLCRYMAWTPLFFKRMQKLYPERYSRMTYQEAFQEWCAAFKATWPSWMIEPESEAVEVEKVKLEAVIAVLQTLLPEVDPENKALLIQQALLIIGENKKLFAHEFQLDLETLEAFLSQKAEREQETHEVSLEPEPAEGEAGKLAKFG